MTISEGLSAFYRRLGCYGNHDFLLIFEPKTIRLRCSECGYITRGWRLDAKPPIITQAGNEHRLIFMRPVPKVRRTLSGLRAKRILKRYNVIVSPHVL